VRNDEVNESGARCRVNQTCALRAFGVAAAKVESVAELRKHPGPPGSEPVPANLLNHADDQTVVAVSAVLHASGEFRLNSQSFQDWGVVAAPRFPGRLSFAASLEKFSRLGPLSVSPLIIPFLSLHAVSSAISLALRIHGPAIGVGGGNDGFAQALLVGLALQQEEDLPGVWVVMTAWDQEPILHSEAASESRPVCQAAALALAPRAAGTSDGPWLRIASGSATNLTATAGFPELFQFLADGSVADQVRSWRCALPGAYDLELAVGSSRSAVSGLAKSA
jgi:hypothetical protein